MDPIYVTGHRNPDTDSIVAAMAYAALRNAESRYVYLLACDMPVICAGFIRHMKDCLRHSRKNWKRLCRLSPRRSPP